MHSGEAIYNVVTKGERNLSRDRQTDIQMQRVEPEARRLMAGLASSSLNVKQQDGWLPAELSWLASNMLTKCLLTVDNQSEAFATASVVTFESSHTLVFLQRLHPPKLS